uniref:Uncharacterized protein n=1 Tax=Oryza nivara TaxID=4536 RepID=A0A0E0HRE0_ORYNI
MWDTHVILPPLSLSHFRSGGGDGGERAVENAAIARGRREGGRGTRGEPPQWGVGVADDWLAQRRGWHEAAAAVVGTRRWGAVRTTAVGSDGAVVGSGGDCGGDEACRLENSIRLLSPTLAAPLVHGVISGAAAAGCTDLALQFFRFAYRRTGFSPEPSTFALATAEKFTHPPPPGATMATNAAPGTPTSAPAGRASMETGKRNMGLHCTSMRISRDETRSP